MPRKSSAKRSIPRATISARVPLPTLEKLKKLVRENGSNMSEIVIAALERYCSEPNVEQKVSPYQFWKKTGLIGSIDDPSLDSTRYKEILGASVERKHGHR